MVHVQSRLEKRYLLKMAHSYNLRTRGLPAVPETDRDDENQETVSPTNNLIELEEPDDEAHETTSRATPYWA